MNKNLFQEIVSLLYLNSLDIVKLHRQIQYKCTNNEIRNMIVKIESKQLIFSTNFNAVLFKTTQKWKIFLINVFANTVHRKITLLLIMFIKFTPHRVCGIPERSHVDKDKIQTLSFPFLNKNGYI